jgi:glucokinase
MSTPPTGPRRAGAASGGPRLVLGIDFGGTKTALAVADTTGRRLATAQRPVDAAAGAHAVVAGEVGYQLLRPGQPGFAAGRAPLEEHVSGRALGERAGALTGRTMTAADALTDPDPAVRALVADALDVLAHHVADLACTLDPDTIAVGGGLVGAADVVLPPLRAALAATAPFPPDVVVAAHPHDAPLVGALALATDSLPDTRSTA